MSPWKLRVGWGIGKRIGKKFIVRQSACGEGLLRGIDHDGRTAGIDLIAGKGFKIIKHRLVDQTGPALPIILGFGIG